MAQILLIDDDRLLRNVVAKSLVHAGHQVIQAEDGLQGIELSRATSFDLVITDLIMPVREGVETIITLGRERPDVPIIAISGGLSNSSTYLQIAAKIGARRVLAKPFTMRELNDVVAEVLGKTGPSPTLD